MKRRTPHPPPLENLFGGGGGRGSLICAGEGRGEVCDQKRVGNALRCILCTAFVLASCFMKTSHGRSSDVSAVAAAAPAQTHSSSPSPSSRTTSGGSGGDGSIAAILALPFTLPWRYTMGACGHVEFARK